MKNKAIIFSQLAWLLLLALPFMGMAQEKKGRKEKKAEKIKQMITDQSYVFKAQTALPQAGAVRQLTTDFDLRVTKDTIFSDLPYFGRAFTAPMNPAEGPLRFTSTDFQYSTTMNKRGGWDVIITPKDVDDPRQLTLSIFDNGSASVIVTSYNRQPISFNGYVTAKR